jgi:hypothetical protein
VYLVLSSTHDVWNGTQVVVAVRVVVYRLPGPWGAFDDNTNYHDSNFVSFSVTSIVFIINITIIINIVIEYCQYIFFQLLFSYWPIKFYFWLLFLKWSIDYAE